MSYVSKHLIEGEAIVYETRLHWIVLIGPLLLGADVCRDGHRAVSRSLAEHRCQYHLAHQAAITAGSALLAIALVFIVRGGILQRNATEMTVTNKRVFVKTGLAARRTIELLLSRVESIGVEESAVGRMFGFGKVIIHTAPAARREVFPEDRPPSGIQNASAATD